MLLLPLLAVAAAASASAAAAGDAATTSTTDHGPHTYPIRETVPEHLDGASRIAYLREEMFRARMKHADRVGLDKAHLVQQRKRDLEMAKRAEVQVKNWGSSYSIQVDIGTPPQSLDTFIDTGSADLWVIGSCHDEEECGMSKPFVTSQSSTFRDTGRPFEIRYIKGETLGTTGEDVVSVGGDGIRTMFGVANVTTEWGTEQSALMGLAFQNASSDGLMPWWQAASEGWENKEWGMYLARTQNWTDAVTNPNAQGGALTFGGIDTSKFYGDASFYPLADRSGLWTILSQGVALNGRLVSPLEVTATTDSGTSIIMGPDMDIRRFYASIDPRAIAFSDGSYAFECGPGGNINVSFSFGVPGNARQFYMWDGDLVFFSATPDEYAEAGMRLPATARGERYCIGNIMGWNDARVRDNWLIGSPFLRNVYSIYRTTPPSHGLAPLAAEADFRYGNTFDPIGPAGPAGGDHNPNNPNTTWGGGGGANGNATTVDGGGVSGANRQWVGASTVVVAGAVAVALLAV